MKSDDKTLTSSWFESYLNQNFGGFFPSKCLYILQPYTQNSKQHAPKQSIRLIIFQSHHIITMVFDGIMLNEQMRWLLTFYLQFMYSLACTWPLRMHSSPCLLGKVCIHISHLMFKYQTFYISLVSKNPQKLKDLFTKLNI